MIPVLLEQIKTYKCRGVTAKKADTQTGEFWNIYGGEQILYVLDPVRCVLTRCAPGHGSGSCFASVLSIAAQIMEDRDG